MIASQITPEQVAAIKRSAAIKGIISDWVSAVVAGNEDHQSDWDVDVTCHCAEILGDEIGQDAMLGLSRRSEEGTDYVVYLFWKNGPVIMFTTPGFAGDMSLNTR